MTKTSKNLPLVVLLLLLGVVVAYLLVYIFIWKPIDTQYSSFHTSPIIKKDALSLGYTLIAPYDRLVNSNSEWKGEIYLLDLFGKPVHTWTTQHQALYSVLEKNGHLLTVMEAPQYTELLPPGGNTGRIQELDWNSQVIWEYKNEHMHHDIVPMPNGDVVVALWEKTPEAIASQIQGGVAGTENVMKGVIWSDEIVEINKAGAIVWSWHSYDHLDPQVDVLDADMPRYAWTYTNGLSYTEHNPIDGAAAFLVSYRSLDEIMYVRKRDGAILWRSPKGMLNTQHDPTILQNGNVMVFDNGFTRKPNPFPLYGSRAVEINPKTNQIVWQFTGGAGVIDKIRFFAPIVGGAQRLPNGNTLITDGPKGHVFEVTKSGQLVWDFINPYLTQMTGTFPNNFLFKARRYSTDEVAFPKNLSQPLNEFTYSLSSFLHHIYPF